MPPYLIIMDKVVLLGVIVTQTPLKTGVNSGNYICFTPDCMSLVNTIPVVILPVYCGQILSLYLFLCSCDEESGKTDIIS
jgi:hypothetical protein